MGIVLELVLNAIGTWLQYFVIPDLRLPVRARLTIAIATFGMLGFGSALLIVVGDTLQLLIGLIAAPVLLWLAWNAGRMLATPDEQWLKLDADALRRWSLAGLDVYPWRFVEHIEVRGKAVWFNDSRYSHSIAASMFRSEPCIPSEDAEALAQRMRAAKARPFSLPARRCRWLRRCGR